MPQILGRVRNSLTGIASLRWSVGAGMLLRPIPARDIDSVWVNKGSGERRAACVFDHELISVVGVD